jgi:hypothetical protein
MIDEVFVQAAIRIRRNYLKMSNNMDLYKRKASEVVSNLDEIINKIQDIQDKAQNRELDSPEQALNELTRILNDVELEGKKLEDTMKPLNEELEKLSIEEQELWRNIKNKHSDINEDDIIKYVKDRLIKENLS